VVEQPRGVPVDPDQRGRGARRHSRHKVLEQPFCLLIG
jgi:hypothetical protein